MHKHTHPVLPCNHGTWSPERLLPPPCPVCETPIATLLPSRTLLHSEHLPNALDMQQHTVPTLLTSVAIVLHINENPNHPHCRRCPHSRRRSLQLIILLIAIICARDLPPLEGSHLIFIIRHGSTISNGSTRKQQFGPIGDKGAPFLSFFILCVYEFSVIANRSRKQPQAALFL